MTRFRSTPCLPLKHRAVLSESTSCTRAKQLKKTKKKTNKNTSQKIKQNTSRLRVGSAGAVDLTDCIPARCVLHLLMANVQATDESRTTNQPTCYRCNTVGRESCLIHTPSAVGRLQLSQATLD